MRILVLIQCTNLGGMEQSALLLMDELKAMGHVVELISINELGALKKVLEEHDIPATGVGYHGTMGWRSFFPLKRTLRSKKADALIMVGHNLMAMLALGSFCRGNRILTLHFHHEGVKSNMGWRFLYAVSRWRFNRITYPTRFIADEALEIVPGMRKIVRVIPYPFVLPPGREGNAKSEARTRLGIDPDYKLIGNAGWLIPRKRWDVFIGVAAQVAAVMPEARFVIAGEGPEKQNLLKLAENLGIQDKIFWLGWCDQLDDFYRALDVMLFNSDWDALGRTPLEAMSFGVPVVASVLHGGLKEVIDSKEFGFLLDRHDVKVLSSAVVNLLQNGDEAEKIGEKGRNRVRDIGSPRAHASSVLELLTIKGSPSQGE